MRNGMSGVRRLAGVAAVTALVAFGGSPAVAAPGVQDGRGSSAAVLTVRPTCTISGCSAARTAFSLWEDDGFPSTRGWYSWTGGKCNYAGGTYRNSGRDLPLGDSYLEFDVKPRACGAARDALRIVVDLDTGQAWYSPDHYTTFLEIV